MSFEHGRVVYELKIPLEKVAARGALGEQIGVGFETPRVDMQQMRQRMQGGLGGGRGGGFGGGGRGGGGGMGGRPMSGGGMGRGAASPGVEPLQLWAKVVLAAR